MKTIISAVFAVGFSAFAQTHAPAPTTTPVPAGKPLTEVKLSCPTGSKQVGGPTSAMEATLCIRAGRDGSRVYHGPFVSFWAGGVKQAEGQYENGFRTGKWMYFDEKGVKTGETNFRMGDYDGLRVEFNANGTKKLEETYVMGKRQGVQLSFDVNGKETSKVNFVDDRPVP